MEPACSGSTGAQSGRTGRESFAMRTTYRVMSLAGKVPILTRQSPVAVTRRCKQSVHGMVISTTAVRAVIGAAPFLEESIARALRPSAELASSELRALPRCECLYAGNEPLPVEGQAR